MAHSLWLVRLPDAIAQHLSTLEENGLVGSLEAAGGGGFRVNIPMGREAVESFSLEEMKTGPQLVAFDTDEELKKFSIKGAVSKSFSLKPVDFAQFQANMKKRSLEAAIRPQARGFRKTELVESSIIDFTPPVAVQLKLQAEDLKHAAKRLKSSGEEVNEHTAADLRNKIFELFKREGSGRIAFKTMGAFCRNDYPLLSDKELKDELEQYAVYNRKGPNRGTWELRPDYK